MDYPEIKALNKKADKLVVMLHGVGSDGNDLISLVPYIQNSLPNCHFISPHAIEAYDMAPFGRQWFSLQDRTPATITKLVANNAPLAFKLIKDKQEQLGLTNADTILFGFSQGTMMGMYLTLIQEEPFAAMVGFSGMLLPPLELNNKVTPFCIIHGEQDDVVYAEESSNTSQYLTQNNIEHQLLIVPNLTHSIDASGMEFAVKFLKNIISK
ncbi:MAG: alpha/beta hydrolase [Rickettsiaceae bacterium]|nr:alpha/beta hydrolase [Rickettsiaceae bacterium]MDP4832145.1 alpha/beta hydrolase [Rickettsiaceae bacterium]MDP5020341.1 alpha/beta hydrolase [Rickettsiaceae bacterium]MDP5082833.1 alpha/beta hydrolase [Rickettsiaceae bacterium]